MASRTCDKPVHSLVMVDCFNCWVPAAVFLSALHQVHEQTGAMSSECDTCMQATYASAEVRAKSLAEMQQADAAEAEKLLQRQQAAEAQYDQGLSKLRATARQLQSLASRVRLCKAPAMQTSSACERTSHLGSALWSIISPRITLAVPGDWVPRVLVLRVCRTC